jgi:hypothetical protein
VKWQVETEKQVLLRVLAKALVLAALTAGVAAASIDSDGDLADAFAAEVRGALQVPEQDRQEYAERLREALDVSGLHDAEPQHFLLVDRSRAVQAGFVYRLVPSGELRLTGAFRVATGLPGTFEHFATPLGIYAHTLDNLDFRAEGTPNELGILGYGAKGQRVFDFGWVEAPRGWGDGHAGVMRLQVHSTDPERLEPLLGRARSKGCVRIPASVNEFLDRRGILDADYERAAREGHAHWALRPDREPTMWPGRYLVVVDSGRRVRPSWTR